MRPVVDPVRLSAIFNFKENTKFNGNFNLTFLK